MMLSTYPVLREGELSVVIIVSVTPLLLPLVSADYLSSEFTERRKVIKCEPARPRAPLTLHTCGHPCPPLFPPRSVGSGQHFFLLISSWDPSRPPTVFSEALFPQ